MTKGSVIRVIVSYDTDHGATYVELAESAPVRSVDVSDLVIVDVDETGHPVGIDFAVSPAKITPKMLEDLSACFPALKELTYNHDWLLTRA